MTFENSVTTHFGFLEQEFGFACHWRSEQPTEHAEYCKDPLSVDIWWGKGEIDITFSVSLDFSKNHAVFRPYVSRSFDLTEVARRFDPQALAPRHSWDGASAGYISDLSRATAYLSFCAEVMQRHCRPLINGDLTVLEQLTLQRRANG